VLACAVSAKADLVVSGNRPLLKLEYYEHVPIVTAAEAVKRLGL
jgi:predicted nucleic acid-binding protein